MNIKHSLKISQKEWYLLKDALLGASYHKGNGECRLYIELPPHLKEHEIGKLIFESLYNNDKNALEAAAKMMTGGSEKVWSALEKL